jgi:hypothetical protein
VQGNEKVDVEDPDHQRGASKGYVDLTDTGTTKVIGRVLVDEDNSLTNLTEKDVSIASPPHSMDLSSCK